MQYIVCLRDCCFQMEQDDFNFETDNFPGDELEDKILAQALEESLRHYREVEIPLRESQQRVIQAAEAAGSSKTLNKDVEPAEPVLYTDNEVEAFDLSAGRNWIYPVNYPIRNYQFSIVQTALYNNTLVSLPTGLGKTFIAAVVMYNFYRWFPCGKVVFMAPTKPLVNQQIDSCYNVMGIPKEDTAELTGTMSPADRAKVWKEKRMFFATPQVITNDLTCGICPAANLKCVVVDEAHKATGNHAYTQVVKALLPFNQKFRILALSATPGSDERAVIQVIKNLLISKVEIRSEDSPDVVQFTHKRNIEKIVVPLGEHLRTMKQRFTLILDQYIRHLQQNKVLYGSVSNLSKFKMLKIREMYRQNPPPHLTYAQKGLIEADFAVCVSLLHSLELLSEHGLRSCLRFIKGVVDAERGQAVVQRRLAQNEELKLLLQEIEEKLGPDTYAEPEPDISVAVVNDGDNQKEYVCSHPKLEKLRDVVVGHFRSFQEKNTVTRAMIFCQYRDTVIEVCHILQGFHPLVKPMTFVGQSTVGKLSKGFTQKQQLKVMQKFRTGGYNTLISTCVGEEGLDIGDVDLIVCYDAHKSPIRLVQRMGRTGRKREGRIIMLLTEGNEHNKYKTSMYQSNTVNKKLLEKKWLDPHLYAHSPRMIPNSLHPMCYKMFITLPATGTASSSKKGRKGGNQDIRKLFSGLGDKKRDVYCTQQNWNKDSIPAFDRLPEPEELHAKTIGEIFSEVEEIAGKKIDFGEHLDWQRTLQDTVLLPHSEDTKDLVHLLQYAEEKRTALQPTQGRALLSQVNCSLMWPIKRKGKRKVASKPRSKPSVAKESKKLVGNLQEAECSTATTYCAPSSGLTVASLQNAKTVNELKTQAPPEEPEIIEIQDDAAEKMVLDCVNKRELGKLVDLLNSATKELLGSEADINHTGCFLCRIGVCNFTTDKTAEVQHGENLLQKYQPVNVTELQFLTKQDVINVNIEDVISPPNSPTVIKSMSFQNKVNTAEYDTSTINNKKNKKPHFSLCFSFLPALDDEKKGPELATTLSANYLPNVNDFEDATFSNLNTSIPHKNIVVLTKNNSHKTGELSSANKGNIFTDDQEFEDIEDFSLNMKNYKDEKNFSDFLNTSKTMPSESAEVAYSTNVSTCVQEFKCTADFNLNIVSHRKKETNSDVQNTPKSKLSRYSVKNELFLCPGDADSEKSDDKFTSQQFTSMKAKQAATPQKLHSILNVERKTPEISPFKFKESMNQQPVEVVNDIRASRNEDSDVLPLSPILCQSQRTQQHNDYPSSIFPKGSSTPKVHKKSLFLNTNLNEVRNNALLAESKDDNIIMEHPKLHFDLMSSFKRICGSSSEEEKDIKQNTQNTTMYTVTQLVNMIDASDSQVTHREQELGHAKQSQALSLSAKRKSSAKSYLLDSEDDIFAELDLQTNSNSKSNECCVTKEKHVAHDSIKYNASHSVNHSDVSVVSFMVNPEINTIANKTLDGHHKKQSISYKPMNNKINGVQLSPPVGEKRAENHGNSTNNCDSHISALSSTKHLSKTALKSSLRLQPSQRLQDADEDSSFIDRGKKRKLALNFSTSSESYIESNEGIAAGTTLNEVQSNEKMILDNSCLNIKPDSPSKNTKRKMKRPRMETRKNSNKGAPKGDNKVIELSSDDSDFESQYVVNKKTVNAISAEPNVSASINENTSPVKKKRRTRKQSTKALDQKCQYVESEAEVSSVIEISSDDEDTSGLDEYDSSFVSDTSHVNDADQDDAQVKFLQSIIRSPVKNHQGKFKIPATIGKVPYEEVFSQVEEGMETSYQEDSFCVEDGEEEELEESEVSHLELAEAVLEAEEAEENWKKRKRKCSKSGSSLEEPSVAHGKRKRIIIFDDSDSEGETNKPANAVISKKLDTEKEDLMHFFEDADFPELESMFVSSKEPPHIKESYRKETRDANDANNVCSTVNIIGANVNVVINDIYSCATHTKRDQVAESDSINKDASSPGNTRNIDDVEPSSPVFVCSGRPKRASSKVVRSLSLEYVRSSVKNPAASTSSRNSTEVTEADAPDTKNIDILEMVQVPSTSGQKENKVSVIMSTRQIASAPEIATALRAQYEIALVVKSITEADYIVSWKTGILRVTISEFIRGNFNKSNDSEEMAVLRSEFMQPYVIIENDKNKPISATVGANSEMWNDKTAIRIMNVTSAGITVLFSSDKADTARLIAQLANMEGRCGRIISDLPTGSPILESRLQYYHSLPGVNLALALKLSTSFSNIMEFIKRCVTVNKTQEVTELSREKAARIYLALNHAADNREEK